MPLTDMRSDFTSARRVPLRAIVAAIVAIIAVAGNATAGLAQAPAAAEWKTSGTVDAGYVSATGNTDLTTVSFGDKLSTTRDRWTFSQTLAYVYGKTSGKESANQLRIGARAEVTWTTNLGGFAAVQFERNAFAGFDRRVDELLGVQWKAIADSTNTLAIDLGGVLTQQDNTNGTTANSPSARGAAAYKHLFTAKTFLTEDLEYLPNLKESGAYRVNSATALVAPLAKSISLKIGYVYQYNSSPPAKFGTTDRVFTSGLQISF